MLIAYIYHRLERKTPKNDDEKEKEHHKPFIMVSYPGSIALARYRFPFFCIVRAVNLIHVAIENLAGTLTTLSFTYLFSRAI